MNDPLKQLEKLFEALAQQSDPEQYSHALVKYLIFVETTPPLNSLVRTTEQPMQVSLLFERLRSLQARGARFVNGYLPSEFHDITETRPFVRSFHHNLLEGAKKEGYEQKPEVVLHTARTSQRVCVNGDTTRCYVFRGNDTERFKIVSMLYATRSGMSVADIAARLYKGAKHDSTNLKKAIKKINESFKHKTSSTDDLILIENEGAKNLYSLNRKAFDFKQER